MMEALGCSELHVLPLSKKKKKILGKKTLWGKYQPKPSLLCTAKRNGKMLNLGEKSEVLFALPREKCLASSPHPNLGNCLIRTLQKAKRQGLTRPFPWDTQTSRCRAAALPWAGCHHFGVSGSCQAPSLSSGPDPYLSHPIRGRGKCYKAEALRHIWPSLKIQPQLLSTIWQEMPPEGCWWGHSFLPLWV